MTLGVSMTLLGVSMTMLGVSMTLPGCPYDPARVPPMTLPRCPNSYSQNRCLASQAQVPSPKPSQLPCIKPSQLPCTQPTASSPAISAAKSLARAPNKKSFKSPL